jgi:hypothetical protein
MAITSTRLPESVVVVGFRRTSGAVWVGKVLRTLDRAEAKERNPSLLCTNDVIVERQIQAGEAR